ncbi:uncharacterized protein LOC129588788 [Paramacrobiotus metropolitanus]|uniref:uncharacterized protein LOC129588788 n=1 Tax=Paramacrobiotus metropolitanus TaxID=2943436 RepID=UPI0024460490|nr:uncharacterized protein LOC129588788 [Paramacrobiotus metropolitanus]
MALRASATLTRPSPSELSFSASPPRAGVPSGRISRLSAFSPSYSDHQFLGPVAASPRNDPSSEISQRATPTPTVARPTLALTRRHPFRQDTTEDNVDAVIRRFLRDEAERKRLDVPSDTDFEDETTITLPRRLLNATEAAQLIGKLDEIFALDVTFDELLDIVLALLEIPNPPDSSEGLQCLLWDYLREDGCDQSVNGVP